MLEIRHFGVPLNNSKQKKRKSTMKKCLIVVSLTIYPFGRDCHKESTIDVLQGPASCLLAGLGIDIQKLHPELNNGNGVWYRLQAESPLLLTIDGGEAFIRNGTEVVLSGKIENEKYMSVNGKEYSFHSREPNFLEKKGLEALDLA